MNVITAARNDLADALASVTDGQVYTFVPPQLDPPCLVIEPADNWISQGDTFASVALALHVYVLVPINENDVATTDLDDALEATVRDLPADWTLTAASAPQVFEAGEWAAYGTRLTVETTI